MRMSPTQIEALRLLIKDPGARLRASTLQALKHRGLVNQKGVVTALGRQAIRELEAEPEGRPETRIHLMNEPATLAQLRILKPVLKCEPAGLSKEDASTLISFIKDISKRARELEARLPALGLLLRSGAQAIDAIGFSDTKPIAAPDGHHLIPTIVEATTRRGSPLVTPGLRLPDGTTVTGKPVALRPRGDVPLQGSRARQIFLDLVRSLPTQG